MKTYNIQIASEYFHHHADGILAKHGKYRKLIIESLNDHIRIESTERIRQGKKYIGVKANSLNSAIRSNLRKINNIKFEVQEHDGVFYYEGKTGGFDFALIDDIKNLYQLRNLCFGRRALKNGLSHWQKEISKNEKALSKINSTKNLLLKENIGIDLDYKSTEPLIVGEIQFGNWGLVYRDFFKVLKANTLLNVDIMVYIVATGDLHKSLSDSIVSFEGTKEILEEFKKVVSVPIWLIGIDFKD